MRYRNYEDYEPERRIWPYVLLAIAIPLIPLLKNMLPSIRSGEVDSVLVLWNVPSAIVLSLYMLSTARVVRSGEGSSSYLILGALWSLITLSEWAYNRYMGRQELALGIPLLTALSPSLLFLLTYAFYRRRKRLGGGNIANIFASSLSLLILYGLYSSIKESSFLLALYSLYPLIMLLVSLSVFFTRGRTRGIPPSLLILLCLALVLSLFLYGDFKVIQNALSSLSTQNFLRTLVLYFSRSITESYLFYLTLSSIFAIDALAGKSYLGDNEELETEDESQSLDCWDEPAKAEEEPVICHDKKEDERILKEFEEWKEFRRLTLQKARVDEETSDISKETPMHDEERKERERRRYGEEPDIDYDDKWYELLRGGISEEEFR